MKKTKYFCEGESKCENNVYLEKSESDKIIESGKLILCNSCKEKYGEMTYDDLIHSDDYLHRVNDNTKTKLSEHDYYEIKKTNYNKKRLKQILIISFIVGIGFLFFMFISPEDHLNHIPTGLIKVEKIWYMTSCPSGTFAMTLEDEFGIKQTCFDLDNGNELECGLNKLSNGFEVTIECASP